MKKFRIPEASSDTWLAMEFFNLIGGHKSVFNILSPEEIAAKKLKVGELLVVNHLQRWHAFLHFYKYDDDLTMIETDGLLDFWNMTSDKLTLGEVNTLALSHLRKSDYKLHRKKSINGIFVDLNEYYP